MGRRAVQIRVATCVALIAVMLFGCDIMDEARKRAAISPEGQMLAAQQAKKKAAAAQAATVPLDPDAPLEPAPLALPGVWTGELTFEDITVHIQGEQAQEMILEGAKETLDRPYPITIEVVDAGGRRTAKLNVEGKLDAPGTVSESGDEFTLSFKKDGEKTEFGKQPAVSFVFNGQLGRGGESTISGFVKYVVYGQDGAKAYTESGQWSASR